VRGNKETLWPQIYQKSKYEKIYSLLKENTISKSEQDFSQTNVCQLQVFCETVRFDITVEWLANWEDVKC